MSIAKKSSEFVKKFIEVWISIHGAPKRLFSDNGGEFNNEEVRDMAENFNIEVKTTAAYSPWSNGLLERHNKTLTEILLKLREDNKCDLETSLNWALMAKNALNHVHGYSPYQLVFGRNPNLPSTLIDKLPALEGTTTSKTVGKHIAALHAARTAFTQSECSERIRRALRKQTRSNGDQKYYTGEKVYYKRPNCKEWKGPGTVIGQDGPVVFVRHGGSYVRVHQCRLQKHDKHVAQRETVLNGNPDNELQHGKNGNSNEPSLPQIYDDSDSDDQSNHDTQEVGENLENGIENPGENNQEEEIQADIAEVITVKNGQTIKYTDTTTGNKCVAKVIGRAGKATGKNKAWYNVKYSEPESLKNAEISVDLSKIEGLECIVQENNELENNVMITENVSFDEAKMKELESWKNNKVYTEEIDKGQKCVSTRWICTLKESSDGGIKPKARLVARGFEETQINTIPKDSPTCSTESLRMILAIIAQRKWTTNTMDIKTAFLQGSELTRDIFIKPPIEAACKGKIWKLRKCVYGLADASLNWYNRVRDVMKQCGGEVSQVDPAVFYWKDKEGNIQGILACHVDDFLWTGSLDFQKSVIDNLRSIFSVGIEHGLESGSFLYIGIDLSNHEGIISLSQNGYLKNLHMIPIEKKSYDGKE